MADTPSKKNRTTLPTGSSDGILSKLLTTGEQSRQGCIQDLTRDGDGKVSNEEIYLSMSGFYDDVIHANEEAHCASLKTLLANDRQMNEPVELDVPVAVIAVPSSDTYKIPDNFHAKSIGIDEEHDCHGFVTWGSWGGYCRC
eukprot:scaffold1128_cov25-Cyclotella_meneghiniana.AAC.2